MCRLLRDSPILSAMHECGVIIANGTRGLGAGSCEEGGSWWNFYKVWPRTQGGWAAAQAPLSFLPLLVPQVKPSGLTTSKGPQRKKTPYCLDNRGEVLRRLLHKPCSSVSEYGTGGLYDSMTLNF